MEFVVLILLIVLNAFFAASEIALISLNDNKIKAMAEGGHKKAKLLQNLLSEPSRFLATIQIGITLAGFLASAFAAENFSGRFADFLQSTGVPLADNVLETISLIVITLVLSYFTLVLGELVPKRLAMQKAETIAMFAATPLTLLLKIASPFVKLLTLSTNLLVRMFGVDPNADKEQVTEEEIRMMVDVGNENGAIQETERMMINNIFDFDNITVSDIITHRKNVVCLPHDAKLGEVARLVQEEQYTRLPVYQENVDNIIGILHVKDLIPFIEEGKAGSFQVEKLMRPPYFVPMSKPADDLFKEMQRDKVHLAVAIDEYGGMGGIVTIEDLLEEIVGNIFDEHDEEESEIEQLDERTYRISGLTPLRTVNELLKMELPHEDYDTLSGFLTGQLGRIPAEGEQPEIDFNGLVFTVEAVDEKRISQIRVSRTE
ncbi:hemolysin family protein [Paenibacillus aurantius]|uniref:Hemolysin family protein n=2 Tax=Paenibacillus aurantius TaxID=2918900 RepID=A0AA96LJU0_9BACL|nr:hemolysin family protein [Paenibacillus aurantius]WJH37285.1 hemolysin family protein [Paenibacillus sp. CC-CFT747]WNQ14328.1 hemolysin family protein [Paenibacillus aurantius]